MFHNPHAELICPTLVMTQEEKDDIDNQQSGCIEYYKMCRTCFCTGNMDPYSNADWKTYADTL